MRWLLVVALVACDPPPPAPVALAPAPKPIAPAIRAPKILVLGIGSDPQLAADLERVRAAHGVPGMGVAFVQDRQVAIAVAGKRRIDRDAPLAEDDAFDLEPEARIVDASLLARLVDRGVVRWDETLGEALPDAKPADRATTIDHVMLAGDDATMLRVIVRAAGAPWEQIVRDEIFAPLRITDCGFGATTGHIVKAGAFVPIEGDNPTALHCPIAEWAKFAAAQAGGFAGAWLSAASRARLHAPDANSALGWGEMRAAARPMPDGHADAELAVIPARHAAVVVTVNAGDDRARAAAREMIELLLARLH